MKKKNKFLSFLLAVIILPVAFLLVGCFGGEADVESYEFVDCVLTYEEGDSFVASGKLVLVMSDGAKEEITLSNDMLESVPDLSTSGQKKVVYIYDGKKYEITINVVEGTFGKNQRLLKSKLAEAFARYKTSGSVSTIDGEISSSFVAKLFGEESADNDVLGSFSLPVDSFEDVDILQAILSAVVETTLNSDNATLNDLSIRDFVANPDEAIQSALELMNIQKIEASYLPIDFLKTFAANNSFGEIYNSIIRQIIFAKEGTSENLAESVADYIYQLLPNGMVEYEDLLGLCNALVEDVQDFSSAKTLLATVLQLVDYDTLMSIVLPEESWDAYANMLVSYLGVTDETRIAEINNFVDKVLSTITNKDSMIDFVTGKTDIDYYDLIVNKFLLIKDDSFYIDLIGTKLSEYLQISSDGADDVTALVETVIANIRKNEEIDWESSLNQLIDIVEEYSASVPAEFYRFVMSNYQDKTMENVVYECLFSGDEFSYYLDGVADTTKLDSLIDTYHSAYQTACKSFLHYVIYKDFDKLVKDDLPQKNEDRKIALHNVLVECDNIHYSGTSVYCWYFISFSIDDIMDVTSSILSSKYKNLANNFVQLNLESQIASDLVDCIKGTKTFDDLAMNVVATIQGYVADNLDDIQTGMTEIGSMIGIDMSKYIEQYNKNEPYTLITDLAKAYIGDENVVNENKTAMGEENWNTIYNSILTIAGLVDNITNQSVATSYTQFVEELAKISSICEENGIGSLAVMSMGEECSKIPTAYIIIASDLLGTELSLAQKIQKYIPVFVEESDVIDFIYADLLLGTYTVSGVLDIDPIIEPSDPETYAKCEAFVEKYWTLCLSGEEISWTSLRTDFEALADECYPYTDSTAYNLLKDIDWMAYINAINNGDADIPQMVLADLNKTIKAYVSEYREEIEVTIAYIFTTEVLYEPVETFEEEIFVAVYEWVDKYIGYYLSDNQNLTFDSIKADLDEVINEYASSGIVLANNIISNLTGDLIDDIQMAINQVATKYEDEVKSYFEDRLYCFLVEQEVRDIFEMLDESQLAKTDYVLIKTQISEFVDFCYDSYINDTLDLGVVAKKLFVLVKDSPYMDTDRKSNFFVIATPILIASNIVDDYNEFMSGLIDINQITNGAITSIDYNKFVEDVFDADFYMNLFEIEDVNSVFEFGTSGILEKETLTVKLNIKYSAIVASLDASIVLTITLNY